MPVGFPGAGNSQAPRSSGALANWKDTLGNVPLAWRAWKMAQGSSSVSGACPLRLHPQTGDKTPRGGGCKDDSWVHSPGTCSQPLPRARKGSGQRNPEAERSRDGVCGDTCSF